ncbi:hypothetical protein Pcinc_024871 [Petrolisthes cinctipes]|uniref:Uncharacterized protein n=1 Tax=Petrolisthes cinctipes TaxID=88211 RepID=A0AAE1F9R1_PETCI|nr:hypothetical protein Pcinc_024871 [Petrolisthes cinctipes]
MMPSVMLVSSPTTLELGGVRRVISGPWLADDQGAGWSHEFSLASRCSGSRVESGPQYATSQDGGRMHITLLVATLASVVLAAAGEEERDGRFFQGGFHRDGDSM